MCERTSETQQEQSCTSIGKSIILTYFIILKDRATLETSDFEWRLVKFSYRLQVLENPEPDLCGPKTCPEVARTASRHEESPSEFSSRRPEEKFPLKYLHDAQKKKKSP